MTLYLLDLTTKFQSRRTQEQTSPKDDTPPLKVRHSRAGFTAQPRPQKDLRLAYAIFSSTQSSMSDVDRRYPSPFGIQNVKSPRLLKWKDLPHWQQDNHYILTHYRAASYSFLGSLPSLLYLHNEFVNIHTHLWGALYFLYGALARNFKGPTSLQSSDYLAFLSFFAGVLVCLSISSIYHLFSNHSPRINRIGNQLDYVGIVALITGSFLPSVYYGFRCNPSLRDTYWSMILLLAVACTTLSLTPRFRTPLWRPLRAGMFVAMGLSAVFPVLHGVYLYGVPRMEQMIGLSYVVLQGAVYILGAGLYAVSGMMSVTSMY